MLWFVEAWASQIRAITRHKIGHGTVTRTRKLHERGRRSTKSPLSSVRSTNNFLFALDKSGHFGIKFTVNPTFWTQVANSYSHISRELPLLDSGISAVSVFDLLNPSQCPHKLLNAPGSPCRPLPALLRSIASFQQGVCPCQPYVLKAQSPERIGRPRDSRTNGARPSIRSFGQPTHQIGPRWPCCGKKRRPMGHGRRRPRTCQEIAQL